MSKWQRLDLTCAHGHPEHGQLVALWIIEKHAPHPAFKGEWRDIGRFCTEKSTGKKLWWRGMRGTEDPVRLKKRYDIWWCPVCEFDAEERTT